MTETWKEIWNDIGDKFDKMRRISPDRKYVKPLIIAHGDLDGIVSAIMMEIIFKNNWINEPEVIFTRPHEVKRYNIKAQKKENRGIKTDVYDIIIVVDIAVNNRDPQSTINFINHVKHKLLWIDHHPNTVDLPTCIIKKKGSCVELIGELFPDTKFNKRVKELIQFAHDTDCGQGNNIFDHSLKINLRSDEARYEIYRYGTSFVGGALEDNDLYKILRKDSRHLQLVKNSDEVYNTLRTIHGKEYLKIARSNDCRLHLPSLFGLKSGASYRITIPNSRKLTTAEMSCPSLYEGKEIFKQRKQLKGRCMYSDAEIVKKLEDGLKRIKYKK